MAFLENIGLQALFEDKNFQAGISRYQKGIDQASKATDRGVSVMSRLGSVASGALTVGLGAATAAIGGLTAAAKIGLDTTLAWGAQIGDLGDTLGMSGQKASAFGYLANKTGLSIDEMGMGLNTFTRGLADMGDALSDPKAKPGPFAEALKKLGVSAVDAKGKLKTFDQILPELMDAFSELPAGVKASDVAMTLFGSRGGSKFLDFLRQGSKGLEDARKKAKAFGLELSDKEVAAIEDFSFAANEMRLKLKGIWNVIGVQVLPIARQLVDFISDQLLPAIVPIVQEWAPKFADAFRQLGDGFGRLLAGLQTGNFANFAVWLDQVFGRQRANDIMLFVGNLQKFVDTVKTKGWGEAFKGLATGFWDWLTGKGGVISQIGTKAGELVTAFSKWAASPETKAGLQATSKLITTGIIDGIKALFGLASTTDAAVEPMPDSLERSVYTFWEAFKEVGARIAEGIKQGIMEELFQIDWGDLIFGEARFDFNKSLGWKFSNWLVKQFGFAEMQAPVSPFLKDMVKEIMGAAPDVSNALQSPFQQFGDWLRNTFTPQSQQDGQNLGIVTGGAVSGGVWAQAPNILRGLQSPLSNFRSWLTGSSWLYSLGAWAGSSFGSGLQVSVQAYVNSVMARFQAAMSAVRNMFKSGAAMSFQEGGWVPRTGQAMVHAGEYVLNQRQALALAPVLAGGNSSRTYNFYHTWPANAPTSGREWTESMVRRVTHEEIGKVMGAS